VLVESVVRDSPAENSGLLEGDIITQIAFKDISSIKGLQRIIERLPKGEIVPILFYRNGSAVFRTILVDD